MEQPGAHGSRTDPTQLRPVTQLPPFSHLVSQDWSLQYQQPPSQPSSGFLDFDVQTSYNNQPQHSVQMQDTRSMDGVSASMGLPHNAPMVLADHGETSTDIPPTEPITQNYNGTTPPPGQIHVSETTQNMSNDSTYPVAEQANGTHNTSAIDSIFLLKVLNLRDLNHVPTLDDLHNSPPIEPILLDRTKTSLSEMQFTPETVVLGAALISRVAVLRHSEPIFPPNCPWYFEAETPHATLVIALRIAQLYLTQEPLDGRDFYPPLGFYPYDEMATFAKKFGRAVFQAPIAETIESLQLDTWRTLKADFEREAML